jgi:hypothetical protein
MGTSTHQLFSNNDDSVIESDFYNTLQEHDVLDKESVFLVQEGTRDRFFVEQRSSSILGLNKLYALLCFEVGKELLTVSLQGRVWPHGGEKTQIGFGHRQHSWKGWMNGTVINCHQVC